MFRLLKLVLGLAGLAVFIWFGANVPLGKQTLFQHLQAIGRTRETQDLLDGTRESAKPIVDDVRRRLAGSATDEHAAAARPDAGAPPKDEITDTDRQHLRKLLGAKPARRDR